MPSRHILFVCTGNTCRSPMAEALFRLRAGRLGWTAASAGVAAMPGWPASPEAVQVIREWKGDLSRHRSQPVTREQVAKADLVVVMTPRHLQEVLRLAPEAGPKTRLLSSFGSGGLPEAVPDPVGGPLEVYRHVRDLIERAMADVILSIVKESKA